jgi:xylan 1,4-beta-xylosidase
MYRQAPIKNPILPGFNPDPSIVRVGGDYYIATSTFEWYPGVQIHHSRDLRHWRLAARPLNRASLLDMRGNPDSCGIWAPCLSWSDGLFWLIYTDVKRFTGDVKDSHNYLTTCATVDGEWSDPVSMNSSGFDPSLFHDDDGRKWFLNMVWDHRRGRNRFGGILLQEYSVGKRQLIGSVTNIFRGTALGVTEAPHLYKRQGWYYLLCAEGGTGYSHAMTLARSRRITGPFEADPAGYLLTAKDHPDLPLQRTGHGDLFETQDGEHWLVHLCGRPLKGLTCCPMGRETALQRSRWTAEGWLRVENPEGPGLPQLEVPGPALPDHPWPEVPARRDFDEPDLPAEFQWLRTPDPGCFMSLSERPGFLRLRGKESMGSWFTQALVARRQEALRFTAESRMEFSPRNFQQTAGLCCYYNAHKYHYLYVSVDDEGKRFIDIMSCPGDPGTAIAWPLREGRLPADAADARYALPDTCAVWLRCEVDHHRLCFLWSTDGSDWRRMPVTLDYAVLSDERGNGEHDNFTGAFVGMCCQDLSGQDCPADFDYFEYIEDIAGEPVTGSSSRTI